MASAGQVQRGRMTLCFAINVAVSCWESDIHHVGPKKAQLRFLSTAIPSLQIETFQCLLLNWFSELASSLLHGFSLAPSEDKVHYRLGRKAFRSLGCNKNFQHISFLLILDFILFRMLRTCPNKRNGLHLQNGVVNGVRNRQKNVKIMTLTPDDLGGILSVKLLGRPMIIVNSASILEELDKKGAIYSDRPVLEMGGELLGYSQTLVLMAYGSRFRTYRKHFSRYIGSPKPIQQLFPLIEQESRLFLKRTLAKPDNLMAHLRKYVLFILCAFLSDNND